MANLSLIAGGASLVFLPVLAGIAAIIFGIAALHQKPDSEPLPAGIKVRAFAGIALGVFSTLIIALFGVMLVSCATFINLI